MSKNARNIKEIAEACIKTAAPENAVMRIIDDLNLFNEILNAKPELIRFLQDTLIPIEQRLETLNKTLDGDFHLFSKNTIALLIQNKSLSEMDSFLHQLESAARDYASHYECTVITAIEPDKSTIKNIQTALEKKFQGTIRLTFTIDPAIIGGMIIRCGDWEYRSTIQSKLMQLHNHLVFSE
jgi:F-type H+-transporting ATPase subunit delta